MENKIDRNWLIKLSNEKEKEEVFDYLENAREPISRTTFVYTDRWCHIGWFKRDKKWTIAHKTSSFGSNIILKKNLFLTKIVDSELTEFPKRGAIIIDSTNNRILYDFLNNSTRHSTTLFTSSAMYLAWSETSFWYCQSNTGNTVYNWEDISEFVVKPDSNNALLEEAKKRFPLGCSINALNLLGEVEYINECVDREPRFINSQSIEISKGYCYINGKWAEPYNTKQTIEKTNDWFPEIGDWVVVTHASAREIGFSTNGNNAEFKVGTIGKVSNKTTKEDLFFNSKHYWTYLEDEKNKELHYNAICSALLRKALPHEIPVIQSIDRFKAGDWIMWDDLSKAGPYQLKEKSGKGWLDHNDDFRDTCDLHYRLCYEHEIFDNMKKIIEECKRRYPVGTEFYSVAKIYPDGKGYKCIIRGNDFINWIDESCLKGEAVTENNSQGLVYYKGKFAEIVQKKEIPKEVMSENEKLEYADKTYSVGDTISRKGIKSNSDTVVITNNTKAHYFGTDNDIFVGERQVYCGKNNVWAVVEIKANVIKDSTKEAEEFSKTITELKTELKKVDFRNLNLIDWLEETKKLNLTKSGLQKHISSVYTCDYFIYARLIGESSTEKAEFLYNQWYGSLLDCSGSIHDYPKEISNKKMSIENVQSVDIKMCTRKTNKYYKF